MKNRLLSILFLLFAIMVQEAGAQPVTQEDAKQIAAQFLKRQYERKSTRRQAPSQTELKTDVVFNATDTEGQPYLYVVSTTQQDGFVLVSGDERFADVLGYSDKHGFSEQDMPENMRSFLQGYIDEMKHLQSVDYQPKAVVRRANAIARTDISPLVTTQWSQRAPYNDLCPMENGEHSATGCVATSMAQVVNYHIQHDHGPTALKADIPGYKTLTKQINVPSIVAATAPFPTKDLLKNTYREGDGRSDEEKNAVATLMYYCGASLQMNYTSSGSSTPATTISVGLINYFGFDRTAHLEHRLNYSYAGWVDLIYGELAAERPVILDGAKPTGAHSFVTDGFDAANTLFHINWGWGGTSDGFFALSVLNPNDSGQAGAASGTGGYTMNQDATVGIQYVGAPGVENTPYLCANSYHVIGTDVYFTLNNFTGTDNNFDIGLGVYDGDKVTLVKQLYNNVRFSSNNYVPDLYTSAINTDFANQTRKLVPLTKVHGTSTWIAGSPPDINYFTAVYDADGVPTLTAHPVPNFQNTTFTIPEHVYVGDPIEFKVTVTNNGEDYYGMIYFFANTKADNIGVNMDKRGLVAPAGIPTPVEFGIILPSEHTYYLSVTTDAAGKNVIGTTSITAKKDASVEGKTLTLSKCSFTDQDNHSFQIDNNGVRSIDVYNGGTINAILQFTNRSDTNINGTLAIRFDKYDTATSQFIDDKSDKVTNNFSIPTGASMNTSFYRDSYEPGYTYRIRILIDGVCMDDRYRINIKGTPETIASASDWENFCTKVKEGDTYSGKIVKMTADITTNTRVDGAFKGVFDGGGHTLNVTISEDDTHYLAPFKTISGATIRNLTLTGSVTTQQVYAAGLVGEVTGDNNHIENCVVNANVTINGYGGGVVGKLGGSLTMENVTYGGEIIQKNSSCKTGGIIGRYEGNNKNLSMNRCLFKGTYEGSLFHPIGIKASKFANLSCINCFYTTTPSSIEDEDDIISTNVTKVSHLDLGSGISVLSGNTCLFRSVVYHYGTVTLAYNDPESVVTYSLDGTPLSGNSFTISQENEAFNDGEATITASYDFCISYNLDGGTLTTPNPTTYTKESEDIKLNNPTRDGWTFSGWTGTDLKGKKMSVTIRKGSTGHRHYTATWTTEELATDESGAYLINNKYDWERFCARAKMDEDAYLGKTVKLTADIGTAQDPVTTKVGSVTNNRSYCFCGSFDGQGHTLYVKYTDDAPFLYTYNVTIRNLHVKGNIIAGNKYATGIVSQAFGRLTISNCHSSVNINSIFQGKGYHTGLVGITRNSNEYADDVTITGCLFDGTITTNIGTTKCAGFIGWTDNPAQTTISNSLLAPTSVFSNLLENTFVSYKTEAGTPIIRNSYYFPVTNLPTNQGKEAQTITAGENVTSLAISGEPIEYDLSGITAYEGNSGLKYNSMFYAGSEDEVDLVLTSAAPDEGNYFYKYTTPSGNLVMNSTTSATLIIQDDPLPTVTINAVYSGTPTIFLSDTEDNTELLSANNGMTRNVILSGHNLQTGNYSTSAVPFDIPASQYSTYNIKGVKKLTGSSYDSSTGVLSLTFADETEKIEAGCPYLVKVSANTMSPTFDEVLVSAEPKTVETTAVNFVPTFGKTEVTGDKKSILFLGANNTLYNPNSLPSYMKGFRAYFQLTGDAALAHEFRMEFVDDADGIQDIQNSKFKIQDAEAVWYTLDGRKLSGKPTVSGIYLNNDKKVIIK